MKICVFGLGYVGCVSVRLGADCQCLGVNEGTWLLNKRSDQIVLTRRVEPSPQPRRDPCSGIMSMQTEAQSGL